MNQHESHFFWLTSHQSFTTAKSSRISWPNHHISHGQKSSFLLVESQYWCFCKPFVVLGEHHFLNHHIIESSWCSDYPISSAFLMVNVAAQLPGPSGFFVSCWGGDLDASCATQGQRPQRPQRPVGGVEDKPWAYDHRVKIINDNGYKLYKDYNQWFKPWLSIKRYQK